MDTIIGKILDIKIDDETRIVKKAIYGDKHCFSQLIKMNKVYLYRIAYSYVKNEEDALEILQECTYRALLNIGKLKNPSYFKTWVTRVVINCSIDFINNNRNLSQITDEIVADSPSISLDEKLDLYKAIDLLKDKYKTVIILKYFNDMSIKSISKVMEIPENTVKTYLRRAKEVLSKVLREGYLND